MTLKQAIQQWDKDKSEWTNGINFKQKSVFTGLQLEIKGKEILITQEALDSSDWGFLFTSHDRDFNESMNGVLKAIRSNQQDVEE